MKKVLWWAAAVMAVGLLAWNAVHMTLLDPYCGSLIDPATLEYPPKMEPSEELNMLLSRDEAKADLLRAHRLVRSRHPVWLLEKETAAVVDASFSDAVESLPQQMTVLELWQCLGTCLSGLKDSHTRVVHRPEHILYLSDMTLQDSGNDPIAINGVPVESIFAQAQTRIGAESQELAWSRCFMWTQSGLAYAGVDVTDGVELTYLSEKGEVTVSCGFVLENLVKRINKEKYHVISYDLYPDRDLAVIQIRACRVNEDYQMILDQFFGEVAAAGLSNIAVDLRGNTGGNEYAAYLFLEYLDAETFQTRRVQERRGFILKDTPGKEVLNNRRADCYSGSVFVFTDQNTYSAGMDFAQLLADNDLAVHIGQPPDQPPDSYSDLVCFRLPNSGLELDVSFKKNYRIDQSKTGQLLMPDVITDDCMAAVCEWINDQ